MTVIFRGHIPYARKMSSLSKQEEKEVIALACERRKKVSVRPRTRQDLALKFIPKFEMPGYRFLQPRERVKAGDFRWSCKLKCYVPATRIGELAGTVHTFVRREEKVPDPVKIPEGYRYLARDEKIKRGDLFWATWTRQYMPVINSLIGREVGTISPVIRKVRG